jgi:hypothetical protein
MIPLDIFILVTAILFLLFIGALLLFFNEKLYSDGLFKNLMKYLEEDMARTVKELKELERLKNIKKTLDDWKDDIK